MNLIFLPASRCGVRRVAPEEEGEVRITRALLSVDDKSGLAELARVLIDHSVELWATAGTRAALASRGIPVRAAEELSGISDWFGGRVKTLHPGILGGVLAPRTEAGLRELRERKLLPFDLVVVNLYPFVRHLAEAPGDTAREEFVDVGGVTLARAAAKNYRWVAALTDPGDYPAISAELQARGGSLSRSTRERLAVLAFERTAAYDAAIAAGVLPNSSSDSFPTHLLVRREPFALRYGENPHQAAAAYRVVAPQPNGLAGMTFTQIKGDRLSFTNLLDITTALDLVGEFTLPTAAVVKHATPCGVASAEDLSTALQRAVATDPVARYGCAIAVNRPVDVSVLDCLKGIYVDLLAGPKFDESTRASFERRAKLKVLQLDPSARPATSWVAHSALDRLLLESADRRQLAPGDFRQVTTRSATPEQLCALDFAWRVVRHAKSNAIVLGLGSSTVGIGAGQTTRVKAVELAVDVAGERARGSVLASDAYFPFADGIEVAGRAGVAAILQPGGSLRDPEVIAKAEEYGMAMYCTGWRVFRH